MAKPSCVTRPICFAAMDGVSKPEKKVPNFTGDAADLTPTRCLGEVVLPAGAAEARCWGEVVPPAEPADAENPLKAEEGGASEEVQSSEEGESPDVESPSLDSAWSLMVEGRAGLGSSRHPCTGGEAKTTLALYAVRVILNHHSVSALIGNPSCD